MKLFFHSCGCDLLITKMYDSCVPRRWVDVSRTLYLVGLLLCELDPESSVPDRFMSLYRFFLEQKPNTNLDMFLFKIVRFCFNIKKTNKQSLITPLVVKLSDLDF